MRAELMADRTGSFDSTTGESLYYRVWEPAGTARASLLLVHGLGEHGDRYDHVGRYLAAHGIRVYAHDQVGHGRSGGRRGWVARFDDFLNDLERFHARVAAEARPLPLILLGHSMGGLIVVAYLLERRPKPDLLVLSGPAIVPLLDAGDRRIDPTRLSRDPALWKAYLEDPLILRERVTDELLLRLADGVQLLPGRAGEIDLPCLLIHGGDDRLCSTEGARLYVEAMAGADKTVKVYPGGRHEMFNETNKDEVLADLWAWIEPRIGSS